MSSPDSSAALPLPGAAAEDEGTKGLPLPAVGPRRIVPAVDLRCPAGHELNVPAEYVIRRALFCPHCRKAFAPGVEAVKAAEKRIRVGLPRKKLAFPLKFLRRIITPAAGAALPVPVATPPATPPLAPVAGQFQPPVPVSAKTFARMLQTSTWLVSGVIHGALLLAASLIGLKLQPPPREDPVTLEAVIQPPDEVKLFDRARKRELFTNTRMLETPDQSVPLPEVRERLDAPAVEPAEQFREPALSGRVEPLPSAEALEMPAGMVRRPLAAKPATLGVGGPAALGQPDATGAAVTGNRASAETRLRAARRGGGGEDTESAVEKALQWLAAKQKPDGSWRVRDVDEKRTVFQKTPTGVVAVEVPAPNPYGANYDAASTGLATLAFLGAGCDQQAGQHKETVAQALDYLVARQSPTGCWAERPETQEMHVQGILTLALAEACLAAPKDQRGEALRSAAQKAVDFITDAQYPYSVWGYTPCAVRKAPGAAPVSVVGRYGGGVEQSVVIWNGMALKAARAAGLRVDGQSFAGMTRWLDEAQRADGWYAYSGTFDGRRVRAANDGPGRPAMSAAALMMRLWTGGRPAEAAQERTAGLVLAYLESHRKVIEALDGRNPERSPPDLYFLHHGTIALFQMGGERWKRWNELMKPMVLKSQAEDGSWARGGYAPSPVMATALGALILESYYRYSPLYR